MPGHLDDQADVVAMLHRRSRTARGPNSPRETVARGPPNPPNDSVRRRPRSIVETAP
jgi:hypothetical protein